MMYNIGMSIRRLRKMTGITQREFAEYLHIPQANIRNWEQGFRKVPGYVEDMIERIMRMDGYYIDTEKTYFSHENHIPFKLIQKDDGQYLAAFCYDDKEHLIDAPYYCHRLKIPEALIIGTGFYVDNAVGDMIFKKRVYEMNMKGQEK